MKKTCLLIVFLCTATIGFSQITTSTYDFESLALAPINGQDNWEVKSSHSQVNNGSICTETTYGGTNSSNTNVAEIDAGSDGIAGTPDDFYLCQSITGLQVGQNYTLCFNYSRRNIGPNPMDMIVTIDGGALTQTFLHTTSTPHYG